MNKVINNKEIVKSEDNKDLYNSNNKYKIIGSINLQNIKYLSFKYITEDIIKYHSSWDIIFQDKNINSLLMDIINKLQREDPLTILPNKDNIFDAFIHTTMPPKVVILGVEPNNKIFNLKSEATGLAYHNASHNMSNNLRGICKEIYRDNIDDNELYNLKLNHLNKCKKIDLRKWANAGILLLNCSLTVKANESGSHQKIWNDFTNALLELISQKFRYITYMLWGNTAKTKAQYINKDNNYILEANSTTINFENSKHFSKCNNYLHSHAMEPIDWIKLLDDSIY